MITIPQLIPLCTQPAAWIDPLNDACAKFQIDKNDIRLAMFLANCAYESNRFAQLTEDLAYSADGLLATWPDKFTPEQAQAYAFRAAMIANRVYANRGGNGDEASGDGWRYRGRGPFQLTFRANYAACGPAIGHDIVFDPNYIAVPKGGAFSAAWYWQRSGCNEVADEGDFAGVCGLINAGDRHKAARGMDGRTQWLRNAQSALM